jgi:phosphatidylserine/phosphatidylglycerophosphate/cardiolipin synthase-like enzyme
MHDKFWLFDAETLWTGSTNITHSGIYQQNNNVIVIHNREVALMVENQFKDMWVGGLGARSSKSTVEKQSAQVAGTSIQVYFAPEDQVINHLIPLVQGAQESIRFMAFAYTQDDLAAAMLERAHAGVDVAGIFERTGSETEFSAMPRLYCAGVPVRQDGNPAFLHHKVIVIDQEIVITGSLNFTDNANQSNNENVMVVYNQEIARLYLAEYDARWAEALEPEPGKMYCEK